MATEIAPSGKDLYHDIALNTQEVSLEIISFRLFVPGTQNWSNRWLLSLHRVERLRYHDIALNTQKQAALTITASLLENLRMSHSLMVWSLELEMR